MTFSRDVLPAPLGPMMARISPASISTLTSLSAWTAPKARAICCTCSKGALLALGAVCNCRSATSATAVSSLGDCYRCLWSHVTDQQLCLECTAPSVLKDHLGLDRHAVIRAIQGLDERRILLSHKATPDFAGTGQFSIIRVELFMEDEEAADLGPRHLWIVRQTGIHARHFPLDEIVDLWPSCQISIARVGQSTALGPVAYRPEVDVDEGSYKGPLLAIHHSFFDERTKFEFVLKI